MYQCHDRYVVITHGTDTMVDNARLIESWLNEVGNNKIVIFAGAFRPLEEGHSDGEMNLDYAIANAKNLQPGVYVSANRQIYDCKEVVKDFEKGAFVPLN